MVEPVKRGHPGESIRRRREEAGLSQEELAERVGVDQSYVSKVERGQLLPATSTLQRLVNEVKEVSGEESE